MSSLAMTVMCAWDAGVRVHGEVEVTGLQSVLSARGADRLALFLYRRGRVSVLTSV